ncbi:MAG: TadE/TadG family type IV pilus assembly protein [Actinomycetes bacterium]
MRTLPALARKASGREAGAAAVEFALILPILLLLVFGIIDFGRALNAQITVTQAAREGARLAALGRPTSEVTTRVTDAAQLNGVTATSTVCPTTTTPTSTATVTANYPFTYITPVGAIAGLFSGGGGYGSFTLTGKGVMRCGG